MVAAACDYFQSLNPHDYWPNQLYDAREGNFRDVATSGSGSGMRAGGVMGYVALDIANLKRWLAGTIGTTGDDAWNNNGYIVYFSDRRGDHNEDAATANSETGEYGFEDFINSANADGEPDNALEGGVTGGRECQRGPDEDGNPRNSTRETYGEDPANCVGCNVYDTAWDANPLLDLYNANVRPWSFFTSQNSGNPGIARVNRPSLFRRALKLIRGNIIDSTTTNMPVDGLTVVAENLVYVQGNYNATTLHHGRAERAGGDHRRCGHVCCRTTGRTTSRSGIPTTLPTAIRNATTTGYRFAVIAGKSKSFTWPSAGSPHFLFGTDGGVGNFLRLMERLGHQQACRSTIAARL